MRKYVHKPLKELASQLAGGLLRLRRGYIDAAESLIRLIDPAESYPYEFVVYRLTGYRPPVDDAHAEPLGGKTLKADLQALMFDVCDSFEIKVEDYAEPAHDAPTLARRFNVSTKTLQRWRHRGLPARRLVFPDGKRRVAFLESSVQWFVEHQRRSIARSVRFSQMSEPERADILRRARRMASFTRCTLAEVASRLAGRTGRAVATIRYTIRNHDQERPEDAIFPGMSSPLGSSDKLVIYRCFLQGVAVSTLARQYHRTRGSVYRIINEVRARHLLGRPISYMYNPQFDLPNADEIILSPAQQDKTKSARKTAPKPPPGLPAYLRSLYEVPLLSAEGERDIFRRYNYLKHKADKLRCSIDVNHIRTGKLRQIERLLVQANAVKNEIVRANLRLVVSIAKKHLGGVQGLFELISDGNVSLMQAVEKFDYSRGNRFSTYASWAIMRNYARSVYKERYQLDRFATGQDEMLGVIAALGSYDAREVNIKELRESIEAVLPQLSPRERAIVTGHYGLGKDRRARTLDQLGRSLGLSKERVRQIEIQALKKLRRIMEPERADLLA